MQTRQFISTLKLGNTIVKDQFCANIKKYYKHFAIRLRFVSSLIF